MSAEEIEIGLGVELSLIDLERAVTASKSEISFTPQTELALAQSADTLRLALSEGIPVYGTSTGFGPLVNFSADADERSQNDNLLEHLAAGFGSDTPAEIVRAAMMLRLQVITQGLSAVSPDLPDKIAIFLRHGLVPRVPQIGSLGASGDLVPMAHLWRTFAGRGSFILPEDISAEQVLRKFSLPPLEFRGRDALALTNGISFSASILALSAVKARRLIIWAEKLTAVLYSQVGARRQALDPFYQQARHHQGQSDSAASVLGHLSGEEIPTRPLQEVYSLRCVPQVLGAARAQLDYVWQTAQREINAVSDNPVISRSREGKIHVLHGGNFFGQNIAFAADALNSLLTQTGVLVERQLTALLDDKVNNGAPAMLAFEPGRQSALAGAQLTAAALVAEMRSDCQAHATFSVPTNGGNQDIVPMAGIAAFAAWRQLSRLATLEATLTVALNQYWHLVHEGIVTAPAVGLPDWLPRLAAIRESRSLQGEIAEIAELYITDRKK